MVSGRSPRFWPRWGTDRMVSTRGQRSRWRAIASSLSADGTIAGQDSGPPDLHGPMHGPVLGKVHMYSSIRPYLSKCTGRWGVPLVGKDACALLVGKDACAVVGRVMGLSRSEEVEGFGKKWRLSRVAS